MCLYAHIYVCIRNSFTCMCSCLICVYKYIHIYIYIYIYIYNACIHAGGSSCRHLMYVYKYIHTYIYIYIYIYIMRAYTQAAAHVIIWNWNPFTSFQQTGWHLGNHMQYSTPRCVWYEFNRHRPCGMYAWMCAYTPYKYLSVSLYGITGNLSAMLDLPLCLIWFQQTPSLWYVCMIACMRVYTYMSHMESCLQCSTSCCVWYEFNRLCPCGIYAR